MRYGFTTGSCAAAAAKAAAYMLLTGKTKTSICIDTPKGISFCTAIEQIVRQEHRVCCAVRKDAGDDPDVTNGILVFAEVSYHNNYKQQIIIDGGIGVGRVTRPGLDQPVGNAAINHVPREMIEKEVLEVCRLTDYKDGLFVKILIPEGTALAEKTFNPRLGIIGGISVLGTTGVVEPMSTQALIATIRTELSVKKAEGNPCISISPGNYGLDFMRLTYGYDLDASVKCSNFIGETLDLIGELGFESVLLLGHIGKLIKLSGGIMNTHSKEGDCRMELLASAGILAGAESWLLQQIMHCVSTEEAIQLYRKNGILSEVMKLVMEKIMFYLKKRTDGKYRIECIVYSNEAGELGKSEGAYQLLQTLQKQKK